MMPWACSAVRQVAARPVEGQPHLPALAFLGNLGCEAFLEIDPISGLQLLGRFGEGVPAVGPRLVCAT